MKRDLLVGRELDPIDGMEAATNAKIAALRELQDYDDLEEDTARTDVHVHVPQPSQPNIQVEQASPGVLKVVFTVVQKFPAWGAVLVAIAGIAAYVYLATHGTGAPVLPKR